MLQWTSCVLTPWPGHTCLPRRVASLVGLQVSARGSGDSTHAAANSAHADSGTPASQASLLDPVPCLQRGIEVVRQEVGDHQAELGTGLLANLTAGERQELERLGPQLKELQVAWLKVQVPSQHESTRGQLSKRSLHSVACRTGL